MRRHRAKIQERTASLEDLWSVFAPLALRQGATGGGPRGMRGQSAPPVLETVWMMSERSSLHSVRSCARLKFFIWTG